MPFLRSPVLEVIIRCSITAVSLDHKEANASVMKFLLDLLICGKSKKVIIVFYIRQIFIT